MDFNIPLWNDSHFYHSRAPWETDPHVQAGIQFVLMLDWVEEEFELLSQELDRAITWADNYHELILTTLHFLGKCFLFWPFFFQPRRWKLSHGSNFTC